MAEHKRQVMVVISDDDENNDLEIVELSKYKILILLQLQPLPRSPVKRSTARTTVRFFHLPSNLQLLI